jgi:hypothetical protein
MAQQNIDPKLKAWADETVRLLGEDIMRYSSNPTGALKKSLKYTFIKPDPNSDLTTVEFQSYFYFGYANFWNSQMYVKRAFKGKRIRELATIQSEILGKEIAADFTKYYYNKYGKRRK